MLFDRHIGIDYSGAGAPERGQTGLCVAVAEQSDRPALLTSGSRRWSRRGLAERLTELLGDGRRSIVGIDHGFAFPDAFLGPGAWADFLERCRDRWPTHRLTVRDAWRRDPPPDARDALRLCERRAITARSVFDRRPHGVAHATFAGIPWLLHLRESVGPAVHFWPYDGFGVPAHRSVVTEIYPSLFRRLFDVPEAFNEHQRDAWLVAAWLRDRDRRGVLAAYLQPPLPEGEAELARREGWILGVM